MAHLIHPSSGRKLKINGPVLVKKAKDLGLIPKTHVPVAKDDYGVSTQLSERDTLEEKKIYTLVPRNRPG